MLERLQNVTNDIWQTRSLPEMDEQRPLRGAAPAIVKDERRVWTTKDEEVKWDQSGFKGHGTDTCWIWVDFWDTGPRVHGIESDSVELPSWRR
jgi:hypothetical protein